MSHHHYEETRQKCIECWVAENAAGIGHLFTDDCFMLSPIIESRWGRRECKPYYLGI